jgi:hypothetical protein
MKSESETKSIWNESLHYDVIHNAMSGEIESELIRVLIKQYQSLRNVRWQHDSQYNCLNKTIM